MLGAQSLSHWTAREIPMKSSDSEIGQLPMEGKANILKVEGGMSPTAPLHVPARVDKWADCHLGPFFLSSSVVTIKEQN